MTLFCCVFAVLATKEVQVWSDHSWHLLLMLSLKFWPPPRGETEESCAPMWPEVGRYLPFKDPSCDAGVFMPLALVPRITAYRACTALSFWKEVHTSLQYHWERGYTWQLYSKKFGAVCRGSLSFTAWESLLPMCVSIGTKLEECWAV